MTNHITRRSFLRLAAGGCAGSMAALYARPSLLGAEAAPSPAGSRPNIILCMCDDLGWGDVGFNGNQIIKTPNLDRMATEGIRFTRFHSGGPVCSPTRGTCLTGRHYFRYGIWTANAGHLPAEEATMARMCKSLGYAAGHFGKWHLGTLSKTLSSKGDRRKPEANYAPPWERDYDESFVTESCVPTWDPTSMGFGEKTPYYHNGELETENLSGDDSRVIMDRVIPFIRQAAAEKKPFLAVVWFHAPHGPVVAGPPYRAMYSEYSEDEQHYYGCITAMDEQVGRLRQELKALGVAQNTVFWFCSDNGPEGKTGDTARYRGSTGGLRGRKRSLFCGGVTVPGLLVWPGHAQPGRVVDVPCSTLDYFPTTMELLNFQWPGKPRPLDGVSLLPLIEGKMTERPAPIPFRYIQSEQAMFGSPTVAMEESQYKLLTNFSGDGREDMLFDLRKDPYEKSNIIQEKPEIAARMKSRLRDWIESCKRSYEGADYDTPYTPPEPFPILTGSWPGAKKAADEELDAGKAKRKGRSKGKAAAAGDSTED